MKDAKGHGSDGRGGGVDQSKPIRAAGIIRAKGISAFYGPGSPGYPTRSSGGAARIADQHGIDTSHLVGYVPPSRPGDQSPTHNSSGHAWGSPAALADFKREHGGPANKGQLARIARFRKAVGRG